MTDRSTCESVVRQLWPYLDSVVPEAERALVDAHLDVCAGCASHFEFARAFLDAVAASRTTSGVSDRLRTRIISALAAEGFSPPR
jgi:hypothetical protein